MKKSILFLSTAVCLLATASCQSFQKGEGGLEYKIVKDAGAEKAVAGDLLSVDMIVTSDRNDSLLQSTYDIGLPQIINIAPDSIPGLYPGDYNSMFKMLGEGDSAIFRLNVDTMSEIGRARLNSSHVKISYAVISIMHTHSPNLPSTTLFRSDMIVTSDRNDSLLQSTYDIGLPQIINIAPDSIPGLYPGDYNSMFKMLGEGDSAIFRLNVDTMS